jgi:hypothetical protein
MIFVSFYRPSPVGDATRMPSGTLCAYGQGSYAVGRSPSKGWAENTREEFSFSIAFCTRGAARLRRKSAGLALSARSVSVPLRMTS